MQRTFKEVQGEWALEKYIALRTKHKGLKELYEKNKLRCNKLQAQKSYDENIIKEYEGIVEGYKETVQSLIKEIDKINERV
jgi:hypothetical protein